MSTCKVCGGAVFAHGEVSGYGGPICNNPNHGTTYVLQPNDNTELLKRIVSLEDAVARLIAAPK